MAPPQPPAETSASVTLSRTIASTAAPASTKTNFSHVCARLRGRVVGLIWQTFAVRCSGSSRGWALQAGPPPGGLLLLGADIQRAPKLDIALAGIAPGRTPCAYQMIFNCYDGTLAGFATRLSNITDHEGRVVD